MQVVISLFVASALLFAQEKTPEPRQEMKQEGMEAEIISVKTLTGDSFDRLMRLLSVFGVRVQGDSQLRTIVVYAPKNIVAQMRHVVEQLDRPGSEAAVGQNIDLTLTLLRCSSKLSTSAALPADMESVARQLRLATQCKDVQVWDVIPMRVQEGKDGTESLRLPGPGARGQSATANIVIRPEAVYRKDGNRYVRFAQLRLDIKIPVSVGEQFTFADVGMRTSGDFREGQKTVLGKVSGMTDEEATFAVITLKVLD